MSLLHDQMRSLIAELDANRLAGTPSAPREPKNALQQLHDDGLTGRPILRNPQTVTPAMAASERSYWRRMAINCGECPDCGERDGRHESDCPSRPEEPEEEVEQ